MRSTARRDDGALFVGEGDCWSNVCGRLGDGTKGQQQRWVYVPRSSQQPRRGRYVGEELVGALKRDGAGSKESFITPSQRASLTGSSGKTLD
jgi:hypothetical protein